jgi:hypothetical protein
VKIPLSLLGDLIYLKEYIIDVDVDVQDNIVIVYISCVDDKTAQYIYNIAKDLKKTYLGDAYE